jgi:hypothetical protein
MIITIRELMLYEQNVAGLTCFSTNSDEWKATLVK